uniref:Uncharacterized protein n=1 Tax=Glossina austeni TaxID=7395 RepID=A0A1A9UXK3_GLOAU
MSNYYYYYCYLHVDVGDTTVPVLASVMVVLATAVMMAVMAVIIISFIRSHYKCKADDDVSLTLSPVIVGSVLTIVIISLAVALKIFMMTFLHNLRRNRQHGTKATATAVVTQTGDVYKGGVGIEKPRWQHTDIKSKSSEDLVEDERDPDVIPSQYVGSVGSDGSTSSSASVSIGGASSGGGSGGVGGVTNNISNGATNGSVNHHFSTTSKWSPSSNVSIIEKISHEFLFRYLFVCVFQCEIQYLKCQ